MEEKILKIYIYIYAQPVKYLTHKKGIYLTQTYNL